MAQFEWNGHNDIFKGVGIYHLTFVVSGREPLLGVLAYDHDEPRLLPTAFGSAISHDLSQIQERRPHNPSHPKASSPSKAGSRLFSRRLLSARLHGAGSCRR